jgi:hypothetical protein
VNSQNYKSITLDIEQLVAKASHIMNRYDVGGSSKTNIPAKNLVHANSTAAT